MNIIIYDGTTTELELAENLRNIAGLIDEGYTASVNPGWEIVDEDE